MYNEKQISLYLNTIFSGTLNKGYVNILAKRNGVKTRNYPINIGDKEAIINTAISLTKEKFNVYITNNVMANIPETGRGKESAFTTQTSIVIDIDIEGGSHNGSNYPPNKETAISLLPLEPTMIVDTGYGIQAYYVFNKPYPVDEYSKIRVKTFIKKIKDIATEKGYEGVDSTPSLEHVFRIAGTVNFKGDSSVTAEIINISNKRYTLEDFPVPIISKSTQKVKSITTDDTLWAEYFLSKICSSRLSYEEWRNTIWICSSVGISPDTLNSWSAEDISRYSGRGSIDSLIGSYNSDSKLTIATLLFYLKKYEPLDFFILPNTSEGNDLRMYNAYKDTIKCTATLWCVYDEGVWNVSIYPYRVINKLHELKSLMYINPPPNKFLDKFDEPYIVNSTLEHMRGDMRWHTDLMKFNSYKHLLNVSNGVVNLRTGELLPHSPEYFFTAKTNVPYVPYKDLLSQVSQSDIDLVNNFFTSILPNEDDKNALLRFLGYCLTGEIKEQKSLMIVGKGGNGKSLMLNIVNKLLSEFSTTVSDSIFIENKYYDSSKATPQLCPLEFKRLGIVQEQKQGKRIQSEQFKLLISDEYIRIRPLHEESRLINNYIKFILSGNYQLELTDANDIGVIRRFIQLNFTQDFTRNPDTTLYDKLTTENAQIVLLSILVEHAIMYYKDGLLESRNMREAKQEYVENNNNNFIAEFIDTHCVREGKIKCTEFIALLEEYYPKYCKDLSYKAIFDLVKHIEGILVIHIHGYTYFKGISLTS